MNNPDRFIRILSAIGEENAADFDRERHAELIYAICENTPCRVAWQRVKNEENS